MLIRPYRPNDDAALWAMLEPVFRAGDTYAVPRDITRDAALAYWCASSHNVFVAEAGEETLGACYLRPNAGGGGDHVANAAFVTAPAAQGRGVARAMLDHALDTARDAGYRAMQFNFVVATNTRAIATWQRAGFDIAGCLPQAFLHPAEGYVDALVMFRTL